MGITLRPGPLGVCSQSAEELQHSFSDSLWLLNSVCLSGGTSLKTSHTHFFLQSFVVVE